MSRLPVAVSSHRDLRAGCKNLEICHLVEITQDVPSQTTQSDGKLILADWASNRDLCVSLPRLQSIQTSMQSIAAKAIDPRRSRVDARLKGSSRSLSALTPAPRGHFVSSGRRHRIEHGRGVHDERRKQSTDGCCSLGKHSRQQRTATPAVHRLDTG